MKRREVLKYTAYLTGAALSAPLVSSILSGCNPEASTQGVAFDPQFFNPDQFSLLSRVLDTILPKTDSPAATEVGVPRMVDHMLSTVYTQEDRADYQKGFAALKAYLTDTEDLTTALQTIEAKDPSVSEAVQNAYLALKQQAIAYYLSTETIGKNFLNYLPVPGKYKPCIKLAEVDGKAWAL
ncbi:MAG: gluconate 2-dehydrogenase subunit 3 family protein [Bacteroidota bacterium]